MEDTSKKSGYYGSPSVLIFLLATLAATLLQYLATDVLQQGSTVLLMLPVFAGALTAGFIKFLSCKQCSRCSTLPENERLKETLESQQGDLARLRRQNSEAERQALTLQRQVAECAPSEYTQKRHQTRFQIAFHATPDPILFINSDTGLVVDVNESFLRLLGVNWQDVMGVEVHKILHWHTQEDETRFRSLQKSSFASNLRASIRTAGDVHRQFLISARTIELEGVRSDIIVARDITDHETLRHELATKTELLESILRHIPYYVYWKDMDHHYLGANDQYRNAIFPISSMPPEGFSDTELDSRFPAHAGKEGTTRQEDQTVMETGQAIINDERPMLLNNGHRSDVLVSKVPLRNNLGHISGMLGIIADISDLRQYERQFLMLLNGIPDPAWIKDTEGRYQIANRALAEMVNRQAADIPGLTDEDLLPPAMAARCKANERAVIKTGMALKNDEICEINGHTEWYEVIRQPLTEKTPDGRERVIGSMGIARKISERRKAEDEIRKLSRAIEQSSAAVAITSRDGFVEYANPRYTEITGYLPAEIYDKKPEILNSLGEITPEEVWKLIQCGEQWKGEFKAQRKGGDTRWLLASISPIMDDAGNILHALIVLDDITRKKEQDEYIHFMAMHDGLTSLPNRRLFMTQLRHAVAVYQRNKTPFALLFLDLNCFKEVNDTLGHDAGDMMLKTIASRIQGCLREVDTAARLGGDEFVVMLHDIKNEQEVQKTGLRIANAIAQPIGLGDEFRTVGAAIGIALCPQNSTDPDELLSLADKAMYLCKSESHAPYITCNRIVPL